MTSLEAVSGCSAKNHPHLMKKRPRLFTFSTDTGGVKTFKTPSRSDEKYLQSDQRRRVASRPSC